MDYKKHSLVIALFALSLLGGCAALASKEREIELHRSIERYVTALRWGRYEQALSFVRQRDGKPHQSHLVVPETVRVASYDIGHVDLSENAKDARLMVTFDFYQTHHGRLTTRTDVQTWWYDDERKRWFLDGALPDFLVAPAL